MTTTSAGPITTGRLIALAVVTVVLVWLTVRWYCKVVNRAIHVSTDLHDDSTGRTW